MKPYILLLLLTLLSVSTSAQETDPDYFLYYQEVIQAPNHPSNRIIDRVFDWSNRYLSNQKKEVQYKDSTTLIINIFQNMNVVVRPGSLLREKIDTYELKYQIAIEARPDRFRTTISGYNSINKLKQYTPVLSRKNLVKFYREYMQELNESYEPTKGEIEDLTRFYDEMDKHAEWLFKTLRQFMATPDPKDW